MDVADILRKDHRAIDKLLTELEMVEDYYDKRETFQKIKELIEIHAYIEESFFYPLLQNKPEFEEVIEDALDDFQEMGVLLEEIDAMEEDAEDFDDRIAELVECVQSHVELEEDEIFPALKNAFSEQELQHIATTLDEARKSAEAA